ncbi:MAG: hypothetical protein QOJ79_289 [Actinomycetota bacterium]|jgi:hypothetical protein|nr:hypothetical protein [Actinomycetota bacterium]
MARVPAKKSGARKSPAKKAARKSTARRTPAARPAAATSSAAGAVNAPPAGSTDLAGGLRSLLGAVETEVRAVTALSERIDGLVTQLNAARDEQAKRLITLDALRGAVDDTNLGTFLDKAIRPRRARVEESFPKRLNQA